MSNVSLNCPVCGNLMESSAENKYAVSCPVCGAACTLKGPKNPVIYEHLNYVNALRLNADYVGAAAAMDDMYSTNVGKSDAEVSFWLALAKYGVLLSIDENGAMQPACQHIMDESVVDDVICRRAVTYCADAAREDYTRILKEVARQQRSFAQPVEEVAVTEYAEEQPYDEQAVYYTEEQPYDEQAVYYTEEQPAEEYVEEQPEEESVEEQTEEVVEEAAEEITEEEIAEEEIAEEIIEATGFQEIVDGVLIAYMGSDEVVTIEEGVVAIGPNAFRDNDDVREVIIPRGVLEIGEFAFTNCTALGNVVIPNTVRTISKYAFSGCTGIRQLLLPEHVEMVGKHAFARWTKRQIIVNPPVNAQKKWNREWRDYCDAIVTAQPMDI